METQSLNCIGLSVKPCTIPAADVPLTNKEQENGEKGSGSLPAITPPIDPHYLLMLDSGITEYLMTTLLHYSGEEREKMLEQLPIALNALKSAGLDDPELIIELLTFIAEDAREMTGEYFKQLGGFIAVLQKQGLTDPQEFLQLIGTAKELDLGSIMNIHDISLLSILHALTSKGLCKPEIKELALSLAANSKDALDAYYSLRLIPEIIEGLAEAGATEKSGILSMIIELSKTVRTEAGFAPVLESLKNIIQAHKSHAVPAEPEALLELMKAVHAWHDDGSLIAAGEFMDTLMKYSLRSDGDLIIITRLIDPKMASSVSFYLSQLTNRTPESADRNSVLNALMQNRFYFANISDNLTLSSAMHSFKNTALPLLNQHNNSVYSDKTIDFLSALVRNGGVNCLDELPSAIESLHKEGVTDHSVIFDLLLNVSEHAGNYSGALLQGFAEVISLCREKGLEILSLPLELRDILFSLDPAKLSVLDELGLDISKLSAAEKEILLEINSYRFNVNAYREILQNRLNELDPNHVDPRPVALAVFGAFDENKAFDEQKHAFDDLIGRGFRVLYYEISNKEQFLKSFMAGTDDKKASIFLIGGHGNGLLTSLGEIDPRSDRQSRSINLSKTLNVMDGREFLAAKLEDRLEKNAIVISLSCSTGEGGAEQVNIANMWSAVFSGHKVFAPPEPVHTLSLVWDNDNNLLKVNWILDKNNNETDSYIALISR